MDTYIPADMQTVIDDAIGHGDYAPYVLDGQTADITDGPDDWHDVVVLTEDQNGFDVIKFTREPDGTITQYRPGRTRR